MALRHNPMNHYLNLFSGTDKVISLRGVCQCIWPKLYYVYFKFISTFYCFIHSLSERLKRFFLFLGKDVRLCWRFTFSLYFGGEKNVRQCLYFGSNICNDQMVYEFRLFTIHRDCQSVTDWIQLLARDVLNFALMLRCQCPSVSLWRLCIVVTGCNRSLIPLHAWIDGCLCYLLTNSIPTILYKDCENRSCGSWDASPGSSDVWCRDFWWNRGGVTSRYHSHC